MNCLPGEIPDLATRDQFIDAQDFYKGLTNYVHHNRIPVKEHHRVTSLDKDESTGFFNVETVFDHQSKLIHEDGAFPIRGLFFLGFPWLRKRKSGTIYGMQDDAAYITDQLVAQHNSELTNR